MAKFKFVGVPIPNFVATMGDFLEFRVPGKDGKKVSHKPRDAQGKAKAKFDVGDELEVTDERAVRHLRADPRFKEIA